MREGGGGRWRRVGVCISVSFFFSYCIFTTTTRCFCVGGSEGLLGVVGGRSDYMNKSYKEGKKKGGLLIWLIYTYFFLFVAIPFNFGYLSNRILLFLTPSIEFFAFSILGILCLFVDEWSSNSSKTFFQRGKKRGVKAEGLGEVKEVGCVSKRCMRPHWPAFIAAKCCYFALPS